MGGSIDSIGQELGQRSASSSGVRCHKKNQTGLDARNEPLNTAFASDGVCEANTTNRIGRPDLERDQISPTSPATQSVLGVNAQGSIFSDRSKDVPLEQRDIASL